MPFFNGTLFDVNKKELMRYAGISPKQDFPLEKVDAALREAMAIAEPKGIWQRYPYDPEKGVILSDEPMTLEGRAITRHLSSSRAVAVLAVTVGEELERESARHFQKGEYIEGLLLDAAATASVEHLADQLDRYIQKEAAREGLKTTWRFSPGYGDWPVTQQNAFCRIIRTGEIGLHATDHSMLMPRKSVTAIIGLAACTQRPKPEKCRSCSLASCQFRQTGTK